MLKTVKYFFFYPLFILGFLNTGVAQTEINGKVIDSDTGEPIPYCNISFESLTAGTSSNELGEFIIEVDSFPAKLIFSHIGYEHKVQEISKTSDITVSLVPFGITLEEVVVSSAKIDPLAKKLAKNAIEKAYNASPEDNYGRAFYRQKSKNGDSYSEFSEIFYDIRYNKTGILDWNISEGRYALNKDAVNNKNYTSFSRILKPLQPNTKDLIFPLHPNFELYYDPRVISVIQSDSSEIAVVHFRPKKDVKTPIFDGEAYIDTKTYDILKIKGELSNDDLVFTKLSTQKNSHWKDYTISYEIAYRRKNASKSLLDYIKVDQSFDYYVDDSFQFNATSTSNLIFYEHYTPTSRKRLGSSLSRKQSDWEKLDEIGYNQKFWEENPIVKRTPVEKEVIDSFEKENAFSSIFLNSSENIALMASNLSKDLFIKELDRKTALYNNYNPIEKVFLHTDKDIFSAGETIWYSPYVVLGSYHLPSNGSKLVHVDLISPNGEIVLSQTHGLLNGMGSGSMEIPKNLSPGTYQLRSYTQWMRNFNPDFFFTKSLNILNKDIEDQPSRTKEDKIDVQFFPEGGHMVADIASRVSFKAIGSDGLPRNVKGRIIDSGGAPVATFSTLDRGGGFFQLAPKKSEHYVAELDDGTRYTLPEVLENGYVITVHNLNEKSIKVVVQASEVLRHSPFYIIGNMRQKKYYQGKFEFGPNPTFTFEIPKTQMPSGILTLTLFDSEKKPWCERPVFVNNQENLVIGAKISTKKLTKRGKIVLDINVTDSEGRPIPADFSMAVTDAGQVEKTQSSGTILTEFLLESEINGHITDPGSLLIDQKWGTLQKLDLVMLTHGWRKYTWPEVWEEGMKEKEFDFSKGLPISGKATGRSKKPLSNTKLNVIAKSGEQMGMFSTITDIDGTFSIPNFNFSGPTDLVFNAYDVKDKPLDVTITLQPNTIDLPPALYKRWILEPTEEMENYNTHSVARSRMDALYEQMNVTELDEVVVTEKKKEKNRKNQTPSVYGVVPDATLYTADHIAQQNILQLISLFPGVRVIGESVSIRQGGPPLFVIDGVPLYNEGSNIMLNIPTPDTDGNETPLPPAQVPAEIAYLNTFAVERVEILKGTSAAIFGARGGNGVILIYTKTGAGEPYNPTVSPDFTISGHTAEKKFYAPKYDVEQPDDNIPDYRATIYWNPSITTDESGKAQVEFFNSDIAKELQVEIEGLSTNGIPGVLLKKFGQD
nr:carboxypeptidase-like regulatory domain-containing protein [uncultured Allomuricauda sp.]